jgi:hypothetical protein
MRAYKYPGTMRICMSCRNHSMRYYGGKYADDPEFYKKGWEFCDRGSEALTIVRPMEGQCLWYEPAGAITTRHTPLVGVRQATYPFWPDHKHPDYEASGPVTT